MTRAKIECDCSSISYEITRNVYNGAARDKPTVKEVCRVQVIIIRVVHELPAEHCRDVEVTRNTRKGVWVVDCAKAWSTVLDQ
jgi:hypothetical protein